MKKDAHEWAEYIVGGLAMPRSDAAVQYVAHCILSAREEACEELKTMLSKVGILRPAATSFGVGIPPYSKDYEVKS